MYDMTITATTAATMPALRCAETLRIVEVAWRVHDGEPLYRQSNTGYVRWRTPALDGVPFVPAQGRRLRGFVCRRRPA